MKGILLTLFLLVVLSRCQTSKPIMTYDYRMTIDSDQYRAADDTSETMSVTVTATAQIAAQFNAFSDNFKAFITYERLDISKLDVSTGVQMNQGQPEETQFQGIYIATVESFSGKVLSLQQPEGQEDKLINWVTVDLIRQVFPDLRRSMDSGKLSQEEIIDDDHLGTVTPHYEELNWGDQQILKKTYTEEDFNEMYYDIGGDQPEISYEQTIIVDKKTGNIKRSHQEYKINLASEIDYKLSQNENAEPVEEILGEMSASIESDIQLIDSNPNPQILLDMIDLISTTKFTEVDLTQDGGKTEIFDASKSGFEEQVVDRVDSDVRLQQGSPIYTYTYDIFKKTLLGQTFGIEARYNNYGQYSNVQGVVVLNSHILLKLLEFQYQHCPGARENNYNKQFDMTLFQIQYPILAVLTLKVSASLHINYGYTWYYGGNDANTGCEVRFQPYVQPGIQATGSASVLGVAEGGMYAQGTVANSYLTFKAELRNAFTAQSKRLGGSVILYVKINPFEYDIGAYYKLVKCDLKKLFRWPPKFSKICYMGDAHKFSLINGKIGNGWEQTIFQWSFNI